MSLSEAEEQLITILKQVMEEKLTPTNVEVTHLMMATAVLCVTHSLSLDDSSACWRQV